MRSGPLFVAAGVALLAALFVLFKPAPEAAPAPAMAAAVAATAASPPAPKVFELAVRDGRLASGPAVLGVREGEEVVLRVTSNRSDELHLHGYDLEMNLKAGVPAELKFIADRSGRFDFELHKAHTELGALEVQPR